MFKFLQSKRSSGLNWFDLISLIIKGLTIFFLFKMSDRFPHVYLHVLTVSDEIQPCRELVDGGY